MLCQEHRVGGMFAQRRHPHRDDLEPVIQVLPKLAARHSRLDVLVGHRDHPDIHADVPRAADAPELACFHDAQQLCLHGELHVADLVEQQCSTVRQLHQAFLGGFGIRKRAALVAKQLALEKVFRHGRAIDVHQRLIGARAVEVDRTGGQLLARAVLASDEDGGRVALRDFGDQVPHRLHRRAVAHKVVHVERAVLLAAQSRHLAAQLQVLDGLFQFDPHFIKLERLAEVIMRTQPHALHGAGHARVGGHHDHRHLAVELLDFLQHPHAVHAGQAHIQQHHVMAVLSQQVQAFLAARGALHLITIARQFLFERPADEFLVVYHQYFGFRHKECLQRSGSAGCGPVVFAACSFATAS